MCMVKHVCEWRSCWYKYMLAVGTLLHTDRDNQREASLLGKNKQYMGVLAELELAFNRNVISSKHLS